MGTTAGAFSAQEFVESYYPPARANLVMSPIPRGKLTLPDTKMEMFQVLDAETVASEPFRTARQRLIDYAQATNAINKDLISQIRAASTQGRPPSPPRALFEGSSQTPHLRRPQECHRSRMGSIVH